MFFATENKDNICQQKRGHQNSRQKKIDDCGILHEFLSDGTFQVLLIKTFQNSRQKKNQMTAVFFMNSYQMEHFLFLLIKTYWIPVRKKKDDCRILHEFLSYVTFHVFVGYKPFHVVLYIILGRYFETKLCYDEK